MRCKTRYLQTIWLAGESKKGLVINVLRMMCLGRETQRTMIFFTIVEVLKRTITTR